MYYLLDNNQLEDSNNHLNKVQDNIFQYKHQNQKLELKKNSKIQRKITLPMSFNSDPTIHITELGLARFAIFQTDLGFGSVRRKCEPIPTTDIFFKASLSFL